LSVGNGHVTKERNKSGNGQGAAWATGGRLTPRGCKEKIKSAYSRLVVVIEVNNGNIFQEIAPRKRSVNQVNDKRRHLVQQITLASRMRFELARIVIRFISIFVVCVVWELH